MQGKEIIHANKSDRAAGSPQINLDMDDETFAALEADVRAYFAADYSAFGYT